MGNCLDFNISKKDLKTLYCISIKLLKKQPKKKNNNEAYMNGSKSEGKKVGLAIIFLDITRRGALSKGPPYTRLK